MNRAVRSALRVATVATVISGVALGIAGVVLTRTTENVQLNEVDSGLTNSMQRFVKVGGDSAQSIASAVTGGSFQQFIEKSSTPQKGVSAVGWIVDPTGTVIGRTPLAPDLPVDARNVTDPRTVDLDGVRFRLAGMIVNGGHLVVGTDISSLVSSGPAALPYIGIGAGLLLVVFGITFVIGVRAAAPVERSRRAQLEFTANASHELRTPLSVIEAEAELALADPTAEPPHDVLARIAVEGRRLRRIVDDLLWLARHDGRASVPPSSAHDVDAAVRQAVERFQPVAARDGFSLTIASERSSAMVQAPDEWLERLFGVLLDNACRVTPRGGDVVVRLGGDDSHVIVSVDDSGPGIPPAERERIFERFHRADGAGGSAGLGLAIADAVVRDTGGRWEVGTSPEGGARMAVQWRVAATQRGSSVTEPA